MNTPIAAPVNVDTAKLVKRTRWHMTPERMILNGPGGAVTLAQALKDDQPIFPEARTEPIEDAATALRMLEAADSRLLLMSLMHLEGDEALLERCAPYIGAQFAGGAKGVSGHDMPQEMQAELRERLVARLSQTARPQEKPISARLAQKMMSVCVGEPVGDEFVPLLLEQAGFTGVQGVDVAVRSRAPADLKVVVIGAGLSGIALGAKLGELGYDYQIFERNADVGGTWWLNRYPGVGVDTPSHYYSYSFEINPDWPRYFSRGPALIDYLQRSADKYGVRARTQFDTDVLSAAYDEAGGRWTLRIRDKDGGERTLEADVIIPTISQTHHPAVPQIKGLQRFKGPAVHTARWDPAIDLKGKRVAVIGTGASSMQVCTTIAPDVAHLTIFQRSKHWIVPSPLAQAEVPEGARWAMRHVPHYAQWQRFITYWTGSDGIYPLAVVDPDWPMQDVSVSAASERRRQMLMGYIKSQLETRPELIDKVTPNYPPMGKRIILDSGWYRTLLREDVDLETSGIAEVTEDAIVTEDGRRVPVDVIVLATGFRFRPMLSSVEITGRSGLTLSQAWGDEDPRAYLGMLVPGFPNLFVMNGPNSAPNHGAGNNLVAEGGTNYAIGLLDLMVKSAARQLEVKPAACEDYNAALEEALSRMVWNHPKASSYYLNSKRRNTVSCPWRLVDYWWMTRQPNLDDLILSS
jgi:4-hydroxyacetophenone monooxygenase